MKKILSSSIGRFVTYLVYSIKTSLMQTQFSFLFFKSRNAFETVSISIRKNYSTDFDSHVERT